MRNCVIYKYIYIYNYNKYHIKIGKFQINNEVSELTDNTKVH